METKPPMPSQQQNFERVARAVLSVKPEDLRKREAEHKEQQDEAAKPKG